MEIAKLVLDYLTVLLTWPVVVLVVLIYFLRTFKESISDFLCRVEEGEGYGIKVKATSPSDQRKEVNEIKPVSNLNDIELEGYIAENPQRAILEYRKLLKSYHWERAFNLIYGTQLDLLVHLEQKGAVGEKYINLLLFYNEFIRRSKLATTQLVDYVGFLKDSQFITIDGPESDLIVKITSYGVDFLSYIRSQYPYYGGKPF